MEEIEMIDVPDSETTCSLCFAEFLDPEDLEMHVSQMHNTDPSLIHCQFCGQRFSDCEAYATHLRDVHLLRMRCCKYCNRVFDDVATYKRHECKHYLFNNKSQYSCSVCKILFNNIAELEEHEIRSHKDSGDGVFLRECLPFLSAILNINATRFLQTLDDNVMLICAACEEYTSDLSEYIDHLKRKGCRSLVCDTCCAAYSNRCKLVKHFSKRPQCFHRFKKDMKQCPECYKMYNVNLWKEHCRNCNVIKCKQCKLVFPSVSDLSNHQRVHPNTVTLSLCRFCNKDFAGEKVLVKHIERAHKAEFHLYKYLCVYCNTIFKHPNKLFVHFLTRHKELEPYTCKICNKKYRIRKRFTLHIKLDHKSIGYVEFEDNYHVSFTDKKSEKPFKPDQIIGKGNDDLDAIYLPDAIRYAINSQEETNNLNDDRNERGDHDNTNYYTTDAEHDNEINENVKTRGKTKIGTEKQKGSYISRKRSNKLETYVVSSESSDDEPLIKVKKKQIRKTKAMLRSVPWNRSKRRKLKYDHKRFVCSVCNKNCYTYQNYNNHISTHDRNMKIKCVKCFEVFQTKADLDKHYSDEHATSQLTQTLRNLLEKRKLNNSLPRTKSSNTELFMRTLRRVPTSKTSNSATLKLNNGLSVQKFIESFTPEAEMKTNTNMFGGSSVTIKPVTGMVRQPKIKMTKCNLKHITLTTKLARPVRYTPSSGPRTTVTFKLITPEMLAETEPAPAEDDACNDYEECGNDQDDTNDDAIPEVAEEVMLEVSEEPKPQIVVPTTQTSFVIPKFPPNCTELTIAQLHTEAPYYKIIKIDETGKVKVDSPAPAPKKDGIKLPDGTKLVSVNPLAHLLGDKPLEEIIEASRNKYYKPRSLDFENAITKAMMQLKTPELPPTKKKKNIAVKK